MTADNPTPLFSYVSDAPFLPITTEAQQETSDPICNPVPMITASLKDSNEEADQKRADH